MLFCVNIITWVKWVIPPLTNPMETGIIIHRMLNTIPTEELEAFLRVDHTNPHRILGRHRYDREYFVIRTFISNADEVFVIKDETLEAFPMQRIENTDLFKCIVNGEFKYRFKVISGSAEKI